MALSPRYGTHTGLINLEVILEDIDKIINEKMISTASQIHRDLRSAPPKGTPLDTGYASSNWTGSVDIPRTDKVGSKRQVITTDSGLDAILSFNIKTNSKIFIQNNVPYMARLNRGWSKQSPAGFVEAVIDSALLSNGLIG